MGVKWVVERGGRKTIWWRGVARNMLIIRGLATGVLKCMSKENGRVNR